MKKVLLILMLCSAAIVRASSSSSSDKNSDGHCVITINNNDHENGILRQNLNIKHYTIGAGEESKYAHKYFDLGKTERSSLVDRDFFRESTTNVDVSKNKLPKTEVCWVGFLSIVKEHSGLLEKVISNIDVSYDASFEDALSAAKKKVWEKAKKTPDIYNALKYMLCRHLASQARWERDVRSEKCESESLFNWTCKFKDNHEIKAKAKLLALKIGTDIWGAYYSYSWSKFATFPEVESIYAPKGINTSVHPWANHEQNIAALKKDKKIPKNTPCFFVSFNASSKDFSQTKTISGVFCESLSK